MLSLTIEPHPLLDAHAFVTTFPGPLGELATPAGTLLLLALDAPAPLRGDDAVREAVRLEVERSIPGATKTLLMRGLGLDPEGWPVPAIGVGLIVFAYFVNAAGNRSVGLLSQFMAVLKVGGIAAFGIAGRSLEDSATAWAILVATPHFVEGESFAVEVMRGGKRMEINVPRELLVDPRGSGLVVGQR